jgi:hypothetical protein
MMKNSETICLTSTHIITDTSGLIIAATKSREILKVWWAWHTYELPICIQSPSLEYFQHTLQSGGRELKTNSSQKSLHSFVSCIHSLKWPNKKQSEKFLYCPTLARNVSQCICTVMQVFSTPGSRKSRENMDFIINGEHWIETGLEITEAMPVVCRGGP